LQGIFEIGLALQLAIESSEQTSLRDWFPNLSRRSSQTSSERTTPKSVEGVTAWDRLRNGTVVAVISGGVKLEPAAVADRSHWQTQSQVSRPAGLMVTGERPQQWWWD
jgi:hypothetical protein